MTRHRLVTYPSGPRCSARRTRVGQLDAARQAGKLFFSMTDSSMHHPLLRLVPAALTVAATLLSSTERAYAQAPRSLAPLAAIAEPVFPSWDARDVGGGHAVELPGSVITRASVPAARFWERPPPRRSSSVALPELNWWSDGILGGIGLAGNAIGLTLSADQQSVPAEGLDPSGINWGIDRDVIGNPSTSAETASDVAVALTLAGPPVLALLTQPGVHGLGNVLRRPFVLYGESLLLAQGITQVLKPAFSRPRPFTYLPAAERPTGQGLRRHHGATLSSPCPRATPPPPLPPPRMRRRTTCCPAPTRDQASMWRSPRSEASSPGSRPPSDRGRPALSLGCAGGQSDRHGQRRVHPSAAQLRVPRRREGAASRRSRVAGIGGGICAGGGGRDRNLQPGLLALIGRPQQYLAQSSSLLGAHSPTRIQTAATSRPGTAALSLSEGFARASGRPPLSNGNQARPMFGPITLRTRTTCRRRAVSIRTIRLPRLRSSGPAILDP